MKATELLKNNETAIMIFTDGRGLKINKDETGKSGVWKINKNISVEKVIIYFRDKSRNVNEIYRGDFIQLLPSDEKELPNRSVVEFNNMKFAGTTTSNWNEFTETRRGMTNPIRYTR
ncbi:MAG TPA: hypothetical protein VGB00_20405 [Pyrinomonadaceae bacterium]